ncbi:Hsp70 family protein [Streptomyces sp. NPDC051940]|uniref:Hsp70 family protein n=1 Tax=Streptomyces sp. NPDC051940 TaxID=3155675 RepID=UPI003432BA0C
MTERIGLDFGTANTVVARWDPAAGAAVPLGLGAVERVREAGGVLQRVVPSLIAYDGGSGRRLIGEQARERDAEGDPFVFRGTKSCLAGHVVDVPRQIGEQRITARRAATDYLADLMALARLSASSEELEIVATAPVESFDPYRDWLVREVGGALPGTRLRVVDEATAAAAGYGARLAPGALFCVVDFGAGTLDVSVVRVEEPSSRGSGVRAVAKAGADLGGTHLDALLARYVLERHERARGPVEPAARNRLLRRLLPAAEDAKIALTGRQEAVVEDEATGLRQVLDRPAFAALLREHDVLGRFGRVLRRALDQAAGLGCRTDDVEQVLLVGGSCLIPAVQDVAALSFRPGVLRVERPLEAVAAGAAAIAGGHELHDHIQHDYALRHLDTDRGAYAFETIVPSGTPYPSEGPVSALTVTAIRDGQDRLGLSVHELTHATGRDADAALEIVYDSRGGARVLPVTEQARGERATLWLNEDSPTFLTAEPPARAGEDCFRVEFHVDGAKRLTVHAYDLRRHRWALRGLPVVQLS